ncbi:MAG: hypothetical protein BAJALOKI1v1_590009 [Promethearchaeota archaeon]|nr:MAG: hypothetical protein BAJALOKI1v1_590009 [Candidatus Lokiarchaeota archaeon]
MIKLKANSTIYLHKIATIDKNLVIGEIGHISKDLKLEITTKMRNLFTL